MGEYSAIPACTRFKNRCCAAFAANRLERGHGIWWSLRWSRRHWSAAASICRTVTRRSALSRCAITRRYGAKLRSVLRAIPCSAHRTRNRSRSSVNGPVRWRATTAGNWNSCSNMIRPSSFAMGGPDRIW